MLHRIYSVLLVCALVTGGCAKSSSSPAQGAPKRIVSLSPSTTELLRVLGAIDRLVGRDEYSVEPKSILHLPVLGDFLSPNVEAIAGLKPDLVLLDKSQQRAAEALSVLGIATLSVGMHQVADVRDGIRAVAKAIDRVDRADALLLAMDAELSKHVALGKSRRVHPRVLVIIDRAPKALRNLVAAGPNTYLDELLTIVGGVNVMAGSPVRYPQLSAEQILRSAPDIIIDLSKSGDPGLTAYELVREVPAFVHKRIHLVDDPLLLSPSARVGETLDRLAALVDMRGAI